MKKKHLFIATAALMLFSLFGCNLDKLELTNPNQLTPEIYFKTELQVQQAVNAIYANLQTRGLYQRNLFFALDNMAQEQLMNPSAEADKLQYSRFSFDATHVAIGEYWKNCYRGINRANFVIHNEGLIQQIPKNELSQTLKDKYIGEAHFLRALYYFLLVTRFGDVPLLTVNPNANEKGFPRSPIAEVWSQIEEDLEIAANHCLAKSIEEKGRATSGAAWALLGKVHLFQANESNSEADYAAARNAFIQVLSDNVNYRLEDRYLNNFEEETEHGIESIFEVEFQPELGTADIWAADDGSGYNEGTFRGMEYGVNNWFNVFVTHNTFDEFETDADNGIKTDPRRGYSIYSTGDLYDNNTRTLDIPVLDFYYWEADTMRVDHYTRYAWRKYQNYYKRPYENNTSGINTKVIRLSDVCLMMAEAENELGNLDAAVDYINQVRNRADVMMPNYGTPAMDNIYPVSTKEQIRIAIEHERKVELCSEQVRFDDLVRWRRLEAFINNEIKPFLPGYHKDAIDFDPAIHELWPIPQSEIDLNPNINKEDQNPGY
ncbi:MAG: RagB/SusD family nutrient uptake outer membrane protein [Bacteroidales bacterium]|nr:RagB/SusD family nutrient uptake outer membrane protein [Bacteroidales bacterium]